jgi:N-acetylglucosaminyldiphosphoundecaprenol N-acetyl-beta-D-mannosaminyltransferase
MSCAKVSRRIRHPLMEVTVKSIESVTTPSQNFKKMTVDEKEGNKKTALISKRNVYCLFGLPVDNICMSATKALIEEIVPLKIGMVLSTININWVALSLVDQEFRSGILNSDFVTLDGKPLLWIARLLGIHICENVPGSTLIHEFLEKRHDKPLTIFLLGGNGNVAEIAMERINMCGKGLKAVGALNPGYGSVEKMSSDKIIDMINGTSPDILLVALGAQKGVKWIEKNRHRLKVGIISHLGATINFLAGNVKRAPRFMQKYGIEWLWRIFQEPKLIKRYLIDGIVILMQLSINLNLWLHFLRLKKIYHNQPADNCQLKHDLENVSTYSFGKNIRITDDLKNRELLKNIPMNGKNVILDFKLTEYMDSAFIGILLILKLRLEKEGRKLEMINLNRQLYGLLIMYGFTMNLGYDLAGNKIIK